jgi:hypothetical protein
MPEQFVCRADCPGEDISASGSMFLNLHQSHNRRKNHEPPITTKADYLRLGNEAVAAQQG